MLNKNLNIENIVSSNLVSLSNEEEKKFKEMFDVINDILCSQNEYKYTYSYLENKYKMIKKDIHYTNKVFCILKKMAENLQKNNKVIKITINNCFEFNIDKNNKLTYYYIEKCESLLLPKNSRLNVTFNYNEFIITEEIDFTKEEGEVEAKIEKVLELIESTENENG